MSKKKGKEVINPKPNDLREIERGKDGTFKPGQKPLDPGTAQPVKK